MPADVERLDVTLEELSEHGVEQMDEAAIRSFLQNQGVGVLGLPTGDLPFMLPLSYGFDGEANLYFTYVVGDSSQKALLSEETASASFLVFDVTSETLWTSVALEGTLSRVPDPEISSLGDELDASFRPEALEAASESGDTRVYRFWIQNQTGIRHSGIPAAMDPDDAAE